MEFSISSWLSPDGNTVASVNGPAVDLIDSRTGEVEQVLRTGLGSNGDVSFSEDGSRVAVNGDGKTVVFDLAHGGELGPAVKLCDQIDIQSGSWTSPAGLPPYSPSVREEGPQYLFDAETLEMRAIVADQSGRRSALSPDGRFVASQSGRVVTNGEEMYLTGQIVLRDAMSGEIVRTMDGLCEWVDGEEWGPDSEWGRIVSPSPILLSPTGPGTSSSHPTARCWP